uniref:Uncharacterized protein n=1 Tax=Anguilla anguilla TaxID=7936 RepID=A0A0E9WQW5_ANGAN
MNGETFFSGFLLLFFFFPGTSLYSTFLRLNAFQKDTISALQLNISLFFSIQV